MSGIFFGFVVLLCLILSGGKSFCLIWLHILLKLSDRLSIYQYRLIRLKCLLSVILFIYIVTCFILQLPKLIIRCIHKNLTVCYWSLADIIRLTYQKLSRGVFPCKQTQGEHILIVLRQYELLELQSTVSSRKFLHSHKFSFIETMCYWVLIKHKNKRGKIIWG